MKTDSIVNREMPAIHVSLAEVMSGYSDEPLESTQKSYHHCIDDASFDFE